MKIDSVNACSFVGTLCGSQYYNSSAIQHLRNIIYSHAHRDEYGYETFELRAKDVIDGVAAMDESVQDALAFHIHRERLVLEQMIQNSSIQSNKEQLSTLLYGFIAALILEGYNQDDF